MNLETQLTTESKLMTRVMGYLGAVLPQWKGHALATHDTTVDTENPA